MIAKSNNTMSQITARKVYQKPTLAKAAVLLSAITAMPTTVSGGPEG